MAASDKIQKEKIKKTDSEKSPFFVACYATINYVYLYNIDQGEKVFVQSFGDQGARLYIKCEMQENENVFEQ